MLFLSLIPFRQFKEQLRQQRHSEQISSSSASASSYQRAHHQQLIHRQLQQQEQQQDYGVDVSISSEFESRASMASHTKANATKTTASSDLKPPQQHQQAGMTSKSSSVQQFDVKTMQKEAVLSYVKVRRGGLSIREVFVFIFYYFCAIYRVDNREELRPPREAVHLDTCQAAAVPLPRRVASSRPTWSRPTRSVSDRPRPRAVSRPPTGTVRPFRTPLGRMQRSLRPQKRTSGSSEW